MQLANPIWLWGLTGILIPIGIHLLSRKEGKVIKFGSLRYLEESQTKQAINIRLNEVLLLVLRCALIFLVVMLLAGLSIKQPASQKSQWIILEPGLEKEPAIVSLIDSLKRNGFEVKNMTKGFPGLGGQESEPFQNYWEMVEQLPTGSLNKAIIVSYNLSSKFKGKRIVLPENVTWISKEPEQKEFTLRRVRFSDDSVVVRVGKSSPLRTSFTNVTESVSSNPAVPLVSPDTVRIEIDAEDEFDYDRKVITASLYAIERTIPVVFEITTSQTAQEDQEPDWYIRLSKNSGGSSRSSNSIVYREEESDNAPLLRDVTRSGDKQEWLITRRLNEETALKEQLTLNLTSLLVKNDIAKSRADSLDQTMQPDRSLWSQDTRNASTGSVRGDADKADPIVLASILIILMAERFVAFKRNT